MAQIEEQDLVYQDQVASWGSWGKLGLVQKSDLKARHHPQNPKIFRRIFSNFLKVINYGP